METLPGLWRDVYYTMTREPVTSLMPSSSHTHSAASLRRTMVRGLWPATSSLALCLGKFAVPEFS